MPLYYAPPMPNGDVQSENGGYAQFAQFSPQHHHQQQQQQSGPGAGHFYPYPPPFGPYPTGPYQQGPPVPPFYSVPPPPMSPDSQAQHQQQQHQHQHQQIAEGEQQGEASEANVEAPQAAQTEGAEAGAPADGEAVSSSDAFAANPYTSYAPQSFGINGDGIYQPTSSDPTSPTAQAFLDVRGYPGGEHSMQNYFQPAPAGAQGATGAANSGGPSRGPRTSFSSNGRMPNGARNSLSASQRNGRPRHMSANGTTEPRMHTGPRPPCSFFEVNRCKNGDQCSFPHILPDGTDARFLGKGIIGVDGRTDNPLKHGGLPPAWREKMAAGKGPRGSNANGGPAGKGGNKRFHNGTNGEAEDASRGRGMGSNADALAASSNATNGEMTNPAVKARAQSAGPLFSAAGSTGLAPARHNLSGTPSLVAAINGIAGGMRRMPAGSQQNGSNGQSQQQQNGAASGNNNGSSGRTQSQGGRPSAASKFSQRLPSGDDFPALPVSSPPLGRSDSPGASAGKASSSSRAQSPDAAAAASSSATTGPTAASILATPAPQREPSPVPAESSADPAAPKETTPQQPKEVVETSTSEPAAAAESAAAPATNGVSHESSEQSSSSSSSSAAAAPSSVAAPAPRIVGSFASAAARGASAPAPVQPPRRPQPASKKDAGESKDGSKDKKTPAAVATGGKANKAAGVRESAPVAIQAS